MSLATKIERLKDEDAEEQFGKLKTFHSEQASEDALFVLGRIKQNDTIAEAISTNLFTQTMLALQRFQQEKMYEALGYETFDKFLNGSRHSPMSKHQYYDRLAMVNKHGIDVADLLTSVGISMRSQKLLEQGDIEIKNDMVYVGGKEIETSGTTAVKDLIVELVNDRRQATTEKERLERTVEKQKEQIQQGIEENEELRRSLDEIDETTRFERALMHAVNSLLLLGECVGELDDFEKQRRGPEDLKLIVQQYYRLSDAYGVNQPIDRHAIELNEKVAAMKPVEEMSEAEKKETFADRAMAQLAAEGFDDDLD